MTEDYSATTVNERLSAAGLMDAYENAVRGGDLDKINEVLAQVQLRQDRNGMNWSFDNDA